MIPLLDDETDLAEVLLACTRGRLEEVHIEIRPGVACNIVVAAAGYPGPYEQGKPITIGKLPEDIYVFHAGTKTIDGNLTTAGGRVLAVTAIRKTLIRAVDAAYQGVKSVKFDGMYHRNDISYE